MEGLEGGKGEGRGAGYALVGATGRLGTKKQILTSAANVGTCRQYLLLLEMSVQHSKKVQEETDSYSLRLEGSCWLRTAEASPFSTC